MPKTCQIDLSMEAIQGVWWKFDRLMERKYGEDYHKHLHGIKCIYQIRKFQSRNPQVKIVKVCDNYRCEKIGDSFGDKSIFVLIPLPTMGIKIICVPEKAEEQNIYFLYPKTISALSDALREMNEMIGGIEPCQVSSAK